MTITAREYGGGIIAVDSGLLRREMAACYLLETPRQVALIEVGCNSSASQILGALERRGRHAQEVSHIIVTHVHLDHAGGAGTLMKALPEATLVVHPRGARHLVDPAQLEAGVRSVYGDEVYDAQYGHLVPVPEERVRIMQDGDTLTVGNRELLFRDTPGHARHHFCIWDQQTRGWFTGDTFGISYRQLDTVRGPFIFPATTPVQFDPQALIASVNLLMEQSPRFMYLTHFGRVGDTWRLAEDMIRGIRKLVELAERYARSPTRRQEIETGMLDWLLQSARAHGVDMSQERLVGFLQMDVILNTRGIEYWLDHRGTA
ncbi:MAG TPA: MBL fold metallo-hydrolase [Xanthomonadales bacterium]|nr:MBL fold metallo-hydrolase [Xanthomonadales bacterium]